MGAVIEVFEDMAGAAAMVRGVEGMTERLVTEGKVDVVGVRGGEGAETSAFQENKNQAKHNITMLVPPSLKGATCSIFPPAMMTT